MPTLTKSRFIEEGVLTPEEFVAAGDLLVFKFKTWTWESGDPEKAASYLPKNKQFLLTRNVTCTARVSSLESSNASSTVSVEGDEWVTPASSEEGKDDTQEIQDITCPATPTPTTTTVAKPSIPSDDDDSDGEALDMETYDGDNLIDDDPASLQVCASAPTAISTTTTSDDLVVKSRTYDISITYDFYYRTPRVWLFGYDENHNPLKQEEIFQDISADHANKTVTLDSHPHLGIRHASIHPCRHAEVMKKIIQKQMEAGKEARVDQYIILFLKFISAVIPTIEHDFTMEIEG